MAVVGTEPGLKTRSRKSGNSYYWVPPGRDIKAGYPIRCVVLREQTAEERAQHCRELWADLEKWRSGQPSEPVKHSIRWLARRYKTDEFSPYKTLSQNTASQYEQAMYIIDDTIGPRLIGPGLISGEDFRRWHREWGKPDDAGIPTTPSRARHLIVMLRVLFSYAIEIGVPGAKDLRDILSVIRFSSPPPRDVAPTREQVLAIVDKAKAQGWVSIAITTLAQFELIERRVHIIGKWDGTGESAVWRPGWEWEGVSPDWNIVYFQNKRGRVRREFDLKSVQPLLQLMQRTPKEARSSGPIIVCETTGKPWFADHYLRVFRKIARAAGVPDTVWSMDMRAAGATEADSTPGITDRMLQDGGGWATTAMRDRYRRSKQRNAQNVVQLRQWAKSGSQSPDMKGFDGTGVYFLRCMGGERFVKIGYASDLDMRVHKLMTGCPYPLEVIGFHAGPRILERYLHAHLRIHRAHGEWFRPSEDVLRCAKVIPDTIRARLTNDFEERRGTS